MPLKNKLDYIPSLNGIRALSALLVISAHWPSNLLSLKFGWIGVNIFFVLSGFLITRILLVEKEEKTLKEFVLTFYYKRALRIFPLYYAFLIAFSALILLFSTINIPELQHNETWLRGYDAVKRDMPYYLTYTYNLKINLRYFLDLKDSSNQFFGHLWSLAVEEQFYLVFPFIVYFAGIKNLKRVIIAILILCPLIRLWAAVYGVHVVSDTYWLGELIYSNTLCQADALAAGAALAVFRFNLQKPYFFFVSIVTVWLIIGIVHFFYLRQSGYFLVEGKSLGYNFPGFWFMQPTSYFLINIRAFYLYSIVNLLAVAVILPATLMKPILPGLFNQKYVDYLGKISYGLYVFHYPLIAVMLIVLNPYGGIAIFAGNPLLELISFAIYLTVVISISHISYQSFEKKILTFYKPVITKS